jgi:cysteine desulfurase/selenocysteine lyase
MRRLGVPATARASFSIYNTLEEVALLKQSLLKAKEFF